MSRQKRYIIYAEIITANEMDAQFFLEQMRNLVVDAKRRPDTEYAKYSYEYSAEHKEEGL